MFANIVRSKTARVAAVACLVGAVMVVAGQSPTGAAPVTKTLGATCVAADAASEALVKVLDPSGQIALPINITVDAPTTLQPEQADVPIKYGFSVTLDGNTTAGIPPSISSVNVSNLKFALAVSGPTETKSLVSPALPAQDLPVTAGQPATVSYGPFDGAFTGIGKGGVIKVTVAETSFTIKVVVAGVQTVNVKCSVPGTAFTSTVKIPGSPDITQPIEVKAQPNEKVSVDILGQFTKAAKDDKGVLREVDPSSFKVLEGPGVIVGGKLEVTAGAAGSTTSITCEVCAGSLPGVNEVQIIDIDSTTNVVKKGIGFTLKFGAAESPVVSMLPPLVPFPALPPVTDPPQDPSPWELQANNFIFAPHEMPSAAEVQTALELTPGIGPGNVVVTRDAANDPPGKDRYRVEFVGALAEKELKDNQKIRGGTWFSIFPQELKTKALALAGSLGGEDEGGEGGGGGAPALTPEQIQAQIDALQLEVDVALGAGNISLAFDKKIEQVKLEIQKPGFATAATQLLSDLFSSAPSTSVETSGETPTGICSQAIVDVVVAGGPGTDVGGIQELSSSGLGGSSSASLAFTG